MGLLEAELCKMPFVEGIPSWDPHAPDCNDNQLKCSHVEPLPSSAVS